MFGVGIAELLILFVPIVGGVLLQIFMSKTDSKWPGLILPGIVLLLAVIMVVGVVGFSVIGGTETVTYNEDGEVIEQSEKGGVLDSPVIPAAVEIIPLVLVCLLYGAVPMLVLLGIYCVVREKQKRQTALDKMTALDLE